MPDPKYVIIMEDEAVIRSLIAKTLSRRGYEVMEAGHGEEALTHLQTIRSQGVTHYLMILDVMVPGGMGGPETLEKARVIDPDIGAIIASGYSDDEQLASLAEPGRTLMLNKPYNIQELLSTVEELL